MESPDFQSAVWRKSTRSGDNGGQCVEVAFLDEVVGLRDSKDRGSGPVLIFAPGGWEAFVAGTIGGGFERV
ncbi:MAG: DUF397 domain-containing protein [Pseudonocardiaceae bacterium]